MTEDAGTIVQRGLSEWWSEETEYVLQRIERWAAFARGYNRLRSQRVSRGRLTMQEEPDPRWSVTSNKIIINDTAWSPRFHNLKRSRRKSRPEEVKINCCGTFNYQSNSNVDSNCLETYRYDHSIYFKTIGDIRNSKKNITIKNTEEEEERVSISSEELVEWDTTSISEYISNQLREGEDDNTKCGSEDDDTKCSFSSLDSPEVDRINANTWSIVNLVKLDLNVTDPVDSTSEDVNNENNSMIFPEKREDNNNYIYGMMNRQITGTENQTQLSCDWQSTNNNNDVQKNPEGIKRFLSFRKARRLSRTVKQPAVMGDNNVVWPSVLLNYTKNVDPATSPHDHRNALQK